MIEDDPHISRILGRWLRNAGYATTLIASLCDALSLLDASHWRDSPHDFLTVDLALPDGDGFDAISRASALVPRPAIVVASACLTSTRCVELARLGVPCLVKPFGGRELLELLHIASSRRDPVREFAEHHRLAPRELEALRHALAGESLKVTAARMNVSRATLRSYWERIVGKTRAIGCRDRADVLETVARLRDD